MSARKKKVDTTETHPESFARPGKGFLKGQKGKILLAEHKTQAPRIL